MIMMKRVPLGKRRMQRLTPAGGEPENGANKVFREVFSPIATGQDWGYRRDDRSLTSATQHARWRTAEHGGKHLLSPVFLSVYVSVASAFDLFVARQLDRTTANFLPSPTAIPSSKTPTTTTEVK